MCVCVCVCVSIWSSVWLIINGTHTHIEHRTTLSFGRHGTGFVRFLRIPGIGNGLWFVPVQKLTESRHGTNQSPFPIIIGFLRGPAYPRACGAAGAGNGARGDNRCILCRHSHRLARCEWRAQNSPSASAAPSTLHPNPGGGTWSEQQGQRKLV